MKLDKIYFINLFFLFSIITSFFIGFIFKEYAPGGAAGDFNFITWPLLEAFKNDFILTIKNYGKFNDGSYPFFYLFNAYINPFSSSKSQYLLSNTFISFITFIFFAILIKKNSTKTPLINCYFLSSIILLLPFYRSSAYWGTTENLGWMFFVLSLIFFSKIKLLHEEHNKKNYLDIVAFCIFSSCALYIRPALVFLPLIYMLYLFILNKNIKTIFASIIFYTILSIPALILFIIWDGFFDTKNIHPKILEAHSYKYIVRNIPILLSYFAFYLSPFLLIEFKEIGLKKFISKFVISFSIFFVLLIIFWKLNYFNYLTNLDYGGGAILKLNLLIKENNLFLMLVSSAVGFSIIYNLLKENFKFNICILLPIFIIYGFPKGLFQEYLEPLILFLLFSGILQTKLKEIFFKNIYVSYITVTVYFSFYLVAATYYDLILRG